LRSIDGGFFCNKLTVSFLQQMLIFLGVKATIYAATFYGIAVRLGREREATWKVTEIEVCFFLCMLGSIDGNFQQTNDMALLWNVFCSRSHNARLLRLHSISIVYVFRIKTHKRIWSGGIMHWKSIEDAFNNGPGLEIDLSMFIFEPMHRAWCEHGVMCFCLSSTIILIDSPPWDCLVMTFMFRGREIRWLNDLKIAREAESSGGWLHIKNLK
jgi:hypothetical protein